MLDRMILNARKPEKDEYGEKMLERMNSRHNIMAEWAIAKLDLGEREKDILDVGCGGGQNIKNMLRLAPEATLRGIDYSAASVLKSNEVNREAVACGRAEIREGTAQNLPYEDGAFDVVTAFETVYYWQDIKECFREIRRTLRTDGKFLVCNEDDSSEGNEEIAAALDMVFYNADDISALMRSVGFESTEKFIHENGKWFCVIGKNNG